MSKVEGATLARAACFTKATLKGVVIHTVWPHDESLVARHSSKSPGGKVSLARPIGLD
jgi:hypothetical protein